MRETHWATTKNISLWPFFIFSVSLFGKILCYLCRKGVFWKLIEWIESLKPCKTNEIVPSSMKSKQQEHSVARSEKIVDYRSELEFHQHLCSKSWNTQACFSRKILLGPLIDIVDQVSASSTCFSTLQKYIDPR